MYYSLERISATNFQKKTRKKNSSLFPDHYIVLENQIEDSCLSCSIYICFFLSLGQLACPPGQVKQLYGWREGKKIDEQLKCVKEVR
jgi:hypothetical protein